MLGARALTGALLALVMAAASAVVLATGAQALADAEAGVADGMSAARSSHGLGPLAVDGDLARVARDWSRRMRDDYESTGDASDALGHNPAVYDQIPQDYTRAAENVAFRSGGASEGALARALVDGWMDSPGHRDNILGPFTAAGVGLAQASDGTVFATAVLSDGPPPPPPADEGSGDDGDGGGSGDGGGGSGDSGGGDDGDGDGGGGSGAETGPEDQPRDHGEDKPKGRSQADESESPRGSDPPSDDRSDRRADRADHARRGGHSDGPAAPTVNELFGAGWPEGFLGPGAWSPSPGLLCALHGGARSVLLLGAGHTAPLLPTGLAIGR